MVKFQNENVFVFLLSTRAGAFGINLIKADTVIIFESDWVSRSNEMIILFDWRSSCANLETRTENRLINDDMVTIFLIRFMSTNRLVIP